MKIKITGTYPHPDYSRFNEGISFLLKIMRTILRSTISTIGKVYITVNYVSDFSVKELMQRDAVMTIDPLAVVKIVSFRARRG